MRTIFHSMLSAAASLTLTAGLVASAAPSAANVPHSPTAQVRVTYADLDLQSTAGRTALDRRILAAAARVCNAGDMTGMAQGAACRSQAIESAHRDLAGRTAEAGTPAAQAAAN